ncbi:MAG TPA: hypothetical protein EYG58_00775 [Nitrospirales bacterium]|nr:hypothetical protein [Nitrospirales bacterium]HIO69069.1 hypothetical protein [Nitrospirales bacterium]
MKLYADTKNYGVTMRLTWEGRKTVNRGLVGMFWHVASMMGMVVMPMIAYPQTNSDIQAYSVTITNLTKGQRVSAPLVWSHNERVIFFEIGMPASKALQSGAEAGSTGELSDEFLRSPDVEDVVKSGFGLVFPGNSVTLTVKAGGEFNRISFVSMLNPTNDGFAAVQGIKIPKNDKKKVVDVPAYDAGSEINDERCDSIPGVCNGEGRSSEKGEGFVHLHTGIHGVGDLKPEERDWRNPVVRFSIQMAVVARE